MVTTYSACTLWSRVSLFFFFSSRRRHTRFDCDWSSDVCSSDLPRDVLRVVFPGVARFQFQFGHVGRGDHRTGVDGRAVLDERVRFFHGEVPRPRSEEHTSELQSQSNIVCRLLLEKKKLRTQL